MNKLINVAGTMGKTAKVTAGDSKYPAAQRDGLVFPDGASARA